MAKQKAVKKAAVSAKTETEEDPYIYPEYNMHDCPITINVASGGQVIFQSGHPIPWPPK